MLSPSLYKKMKQTTSSACDHPARLINSRNGSTMASANVCGGTAATGSRTSSVITSPGSMNSAVTRNTDDHGTRSATISATEPGTRLEIRYAFP